VQNNLNDKDICLKKAKKIGENGRENPKMEEAKKLEKVADPYNKINKKYPELGSITSNEDTLKIYSQLEAIKWQKIYAIFSIVLTIALISITMFYANRTSELNNIAANQFDILNRPILRIENIDKNYFHSFIEVQNEGNSPAEIISINLTLCHLSTTSYILYFS